MLETTMLMVDPVALLADVGVDSAKWADPNWRMPTADLNAFAGRVEVALGREDFGLLAADHIKPQALNRLGLHEPQG